MMCRYTYHMCLCHLLMSCMRIYIASIDIDAYVKYTCIIYTYLFIDIDVMCMM